MTTDQARRVGRLAYKTGDRRIVPRMILVEYGIQAARAWYDGWDFENATDLEY